MLNPFPELLSYSTLAPFILRVVLGLVFLDLGILKIKRKHLSWPALLGAIEVIGAIMLFVGFYTQIAALAIVITTATELYIEWKDSQVLKGDFVFYLLLLAISLSLLLTGAGAFARDIPL
ncbi:hypothetical protein KW800_00860 [Candidatus Parcubacteria bacterium]|nr:hypothetical protein [Candidatus Parcubacteria bacterium]